MSNHDVWPSLPLDAWRDTYATLHLWTQIIGKVRLALAPMINHWWQVTFYVTSRGLTTSPIPHGDRTFDVTFDFVDQKGASVKSVSSRDRNGPAVAHGQRADTVPRLAGQGMSEPLAVYQGPGRTRLADMPKFFPNPRAALSYGADSLRFYVETYGLPHGARLAARALDQSGHEVWHDTVALTGTDAFASVLAVLRPGDVPVGQGRFEVSTVGAGATTTGASRSTPFLVSFSDQWAITNYDQMISLLRYFERQDWVDKLRQAAAEQRPTVWREFYTATDPVGGTPENEALEAYFRRVQFANQRFRESGDAGWLTDRGEVYVTLGEPDDVFDFSTDASRSGVRGIRWTYNSLRLTLFFQDQNGFGRFRLTPLSRAEFQRAAAQVRRHQ